MAIEACVKIGEQAVMHRLHLDDRLGRTLAPVIARELAERALMFEITRMQQALDHEFGAPGSAG